MYEEQQAMILELGYADPAAALGQYAGPGGDPTEIILEPGPPEEPYLPSSDMSPDEWAEYDEWVKNYPDIEPGDPVPGDLPQGFGWPGAVAIRPARWNIETSDYRVAFGDTLAGLATTYLGSPQRWRDIWNEQDDQYRMNRDPDQLYVDEWIRMPQDALATLLVALGRKPPPGTTPAPIPPGGHKTVGPAPPKKRPWWHYGLGAGAVGVVGVGSYYLLT